jgi:lipopolysaccharide transport system permease protein
MTVIDTSTVETLPHPVSAPPPPEADELIIRAVRGWIGIDWAEIVRFRELLFFLVWRDLKVRYKQTVLGVVWAIIQPVVNTALIVLLDRVANITSDGYPRALYIYAGILPWTFFSTGVSLGGMSLVNQTHLLTKVYFPRLFVPTASVGAGLMDMFISFLMFAALMAAFHFVPSWQFVFLPLLVAQMILATLGATYLLASLTVSYRDFRYVIPFMIQGLMFLSPVLLPVSMIPHRYQLLLALNPMVGIINGFRSAIFGAPWNFATLGISAGVSVVLFLFGLFYFRKTERRFADIA